MIGGGVAFAAALGLVSVSQGFIVLLIGWMVYYPASGAFVSLSQASLMDSAPSRREQNMVRWEFVGWVGYALGPLALMAAIAVGLGWRIAFLSMAAITVPAIIAVSRIPIGPRRNEPDLKAPSFADGVRTAIKALKRFRVIKWLALLQASDLMLAIFSSFLALYMVDVSGVSESKAALTLSVWLGVSLLGNLFLIPLLERMRGLTYLQFSVIAVLALYPAFLLVSSFEMKLIVVGLLGFASAGWYSILQGHSSPIQQHRCRGLGWSRPPGDSARRAARLYCARLRERLRDFRFPDSAWAWGGLDCLGTKHCDVAAVGGAGCAALRSMGGRECAGAESRKYHVGLGLEDSPRRALGARGSCLSCLTGEDGVLWRWLERGRLRGLGEPPSLVLPPPGEGSGHIGLSRRGKDKNLGRRNRIWRVNSFDFLW